MAIVYKLSGTVAFDVLVFELGGQHKCRVAALQVSQVKLQDHAFSVSKVALYNERHNIAMVEESSLLMLPGLKVPGFSFCFGHVVSLLVAHAARFTPLAHLPTAAGCCGGRSWGESRNLGECCCLFV